MALVKVTGKIAEETLKNQKQRNQILAEHSVETGFVDLDYALGGLRRGETYLLASAPVRGKTAFALNVAEHLAIEGQKKVAYFSLNLDMEEIVRRCLQLISQTVHSSKSDTLCLESDTDIKQAIEKLDQSSLYIDDSYGLNTEDIMNECSCSGPLDLIIIDYLQKMGHSTDNESTADKLCQIRILAEKFNSPVLILYRLVEANRQELDYVPSVNDIDDLEILRNSDHVILLTIDYQCQLDGDSYAANFNIVKNKHGMQRTVFLEWNPSSMRFYSQDNVEKKPKSENNNMFETIRNEWNQILLNIKAEWELTDKTYGTWLAPLKPYSLSQGVMILKLDGDPMGCGYVEKRFSLQIMEQIHKLTGKRVEVEVRSDVETIS